ncbi:MAG: hypothetical protein ABSH49_14975 [Bryobacteraceae bacterium]|jgi:hypothetical protein
MKIAVLRVLAPAAFCAAAFAQQWEVGAVGGASFLNTVPVSSSGGSARAGFAPGVAGGAYFGQNLYSNLSGAIRYDFFQSDLKLSSGGTSATFTGIAHAIHYDLIWHTRRSESATQFYVTVGGGMKLFQGLGSPEAYQPLMQFGYFTKTHAAEPMGTAAAGLTYRLGPRMFLRFEVRDFISPFPTAVLTPAPGAKYGSILNDLTPMVGISYAF